jgi:quercetin dioxygenase-like cupin family protein
MHTYPRKIENGSGEELVFLRVVREQGVDRLEVDIRAQPGAGPPMHVHYLQEEAMTVVAGKLGFQTDGEQPRYVGPGETMIFAPGVAHRWWNAGTTELHCTGWAKPPHNVEYFLTALFDSMKRSGRKRPEFFDAAFLLTRYRAEMNMLEIPAVVQKGDFSRSPGCRQDSRKVRQIQRCTRTRPGVTSWRSSSSQCGLTAIGKTVDGGGRKSAACWVLRSSVAALGGIQIRRSSCQPSNESLLCSPIGTSQPHTTSWFKHLGSLREECIEPPRASRSMPRFVPGMQPSGSIASPLSTISILLSP